MSDTITVDRLQLITGFSEESIHYLHKVGTFNTRGVPRKMKYDSLDFALYYIYDDNFINDNAYKDSPQEIKEAKLKYVQALKSMLKKNLGRRTTTIDGLDYKRPDFEEFPILFSAWAKLLTT